MRSGREQFRDTSSFESLFDETECGSESCSSGTDDNGIKGVIDDRVLFEKVILELLIGLPLSLWTRYRWTESKSYF